MRQLRDEIRRWRPGFVHLHAPDPAAAAGLLAMLPKGVRLVVHRHSNYSERGVTGRAVERALLRRADVIAVPSEEYLRDTDMPGDFVAKCTVIPYIIDCDRFAPRDGRVEEIRARYGDRPLLMAFSSNSRTGDGLGVLQEAGALVTHDCRIMVAGSGKIAGQPEDNERASASRMRFAGQIADDDLGAWPAAADLFILPATVREEVCVPALARAMWCGTPAVTFTVPGAGINSLNINGVTGIEVDNGNARQLAAAIDHLLTHDEMRREYGRAARKRVEESMTLAAASDAIERLYA